MPAQQWPCYSRLLSQKQHVQQLLLQQLSANTAFLYNVSFYSCMPKNFSSNSKWMQNNSALMLQTYGERLPPLLGRMDPCVLTVLLKTCADEGVHQEGRVPFKQPFPSRLHWQWRAELRVSALLGYFHWKELGFAQWPLSTFLRFFSSVLCKSGLEVIAESTGS